MSNPADDQATVEVLRQSLALIIDALHPDGRADSLAALAAADSATSALADAQSALVARARGAGHTWSEIGDILRISRQAAQQRFGARAVPVPDRRPVLAARTIADLCAAGDFAAARADWTDQMRAAVSPEQLRDLWRSIENDAGALQLIGRANTGSRGPYQVVDLPLIFHHGPVWMRTSFTHAGKVAGLFLRFSAFDDDPALDD
ncbi:DUF3887 domain-containing protein [Williamsia sp. CHRR-6]|uniref:DUF3887 domain-containing protein n=1 Tax=Williamsia sp. CHRR-6 TaxID=2835871 RepID=UPI001BD92823|nr:DUF3887 domain-containing protein [Williamsia sp. CHRR-6]MBT0566709.1 DUF3887 domain-containing protein [Williamsia sp. CHRR-6]